MGKCPHCGSKNIRRRYREHRRYKWRCRSCNRVFRSPKRGGAMWLIVPAVVVLAAVVFAVQQDMVALPPALSPIERQIDRASETVFPNSTPIAPVATLTTKLQSVSTSVAGNAPKVQATIDANVRSAANAVSGTAAVPVPSVPATKPTATFTPIPTPTVVSTPTPVPPPHMRHIEEKQYMLTLINAERKKAGVPPVELGNNDAAQLQAESGVENCFPSHWGIDGLKPYMRYSLSGGYQSNGENGSGAVCTSAVVPNGKWVVESTMNSLVNSAAHLGNILNSHHRKVNLGIAYDRRSVSVVQHFEGDYVEYDVLPTIADGVLYFSGGTKNGVRFDKKEDLGVDLFYDPPPYRLTREDVSDTYAYCYGLKVAGFVWPLTDGWNWGTHTFDSGYEPCPGDPYGTSYDEDTKGAWIVAKEWTVFSTTFAIEADISKVLEKYGDGVYSVMVWADINGERAVISEYSIFHGITPPDTYTPR